MRRTLLVAALAAVVFITAAPAHAATLRGRILGQPHVHGSQATVPVLLDDASVRRLDARAVKAMVTVPAGSGFRTVSTGRTTAGGTRLGDVVSARVGSLSAHGAATARYLKIERRSTAPSFAALGTRLRAARAGAGQALGDVARTAQAEQSGPPDPGLLRTSLLQVRYQLNLLIADLRQQADGIDQVVADLQGAPQDDSTSALIQQLSAASSALRDAASNLDDAVAALDEFINSIGGAGTPPPSTGTADTVGAVLQAAQDVLSSLDNVLPGLPGVPAPPVPVS